MADEVKRNTTLTYAGHDLMAKCFTGNKLDISKVVMGDGDVPEGIESVKELTSVISPKLTLDVVRRKVDGTGTAVIECQYTNNNLDRGFSAKELGVYAIDPETGDEVLYAYRNTGKYSEYIPASGSGEILNQIYSVIIVVGQIENVNVEIKEGIGSVSRAEYYGHLSDNNPHPQFLQLDVNKVNDCKDVWVGNGEQRRLQRMGISDFREKVLGDNASQIPIMAGRISQLELELENIGIQTMIKEELDLSNMFIYENFSPANRIDDTKTKVTGISAGSRTLDVESLEGIMQGSWYWVTDGILKEPIQVASMQNNDDLRRIITKTPIVNTYNIPQTMLYRSTAGVKNGKVVGSADRRAATWNPTLVWKGQNANIKTVVALESSLTNTANFTTTGDAKFTADGYMTLDTSIHHSHAVGIALITSGGGSGKWKRIDEAGDNV